MNAIRTMAALALAVWALAAYSQSEPSLSYVASVKPTEEDRGISEYAPGGRFTATAITVRTLVRLAYRIQDYQLVDAPAWISSRRYEIAAKVEDNPSPPQAVLLRALLKDRFHLLVHNETRQLPTFALVLARDGKLGPQLVRSNFDCAACLQGPHPPPEPGRPPVCATNIGNGTLLGKAISLPHLATSLAPFVHRFTLDKTGLAGLFDVDLTWTPDSALAAPNAGPPESIFSTIPHQLGLKLVPEKGPVEALVIDRVEEPSEN